MPIRLPQIRQFSNTVQERQCPVAVWFVRKVKANKFQRCQDQEPNPKKPFSPGIRESLKKKVIYINYSRYLKNKGCLKILKGKALYFSSKVITCTAGRMVCDPRLFLVLTAGGQTAHCRPSAVR